MITKSHRQEGLARAYVQAVAAKAGFGCNPRTVDYGMDLALNQITMVAGSLSESGMALDIQARSSTTAKLTDEFIIYDIDVRTYDVLRIPHPDVPRLLVLLVLHGNEENWLRLTEEELLLRGAAYWYSVKGEPQSTNRRSIRLSIPRLQLFTPDALHEMAKRKRRGEEL